jgi:hypothetical protein
MNIKELEKQATEMGSNHQDFIFNREKFAELVAAHEREECAKLCQRFSDRMMSAGECADAIRARNKA